jgi:hypothetical protein
MGDFLLPKQMLYQAELRPDRAAPEQGGPAAWQARTGRNTMRRFATEIPYKLGI